MFIFLVVLIAALYKFLLMLPLSFVFLCRSIKVETSVVLREAS